MIFGKNKSVEERINIIIIIILVISILAKGFSSI